METFGEWLRQQRERLKLTREQFAGRVGCSVALLRKVEDGERRPSAQLAELLAHAPRVKLLATSRESLGLHGEWVFEVQGARAGQNL